MKCEKKRYAPYRPIQRNAPEQKWFDPIHKRIQIPKREQTQDEAPGDENVSEFTDDLKAGIFVACHLFFEVKLGIQAAS